jgi:hypothetical protein
VGRAGLGPRQADHLADHTATRLHTRTTTIAAATPRGRGDLPAEAAAQAEQWRQEARRYQDAEAARRQKERIARDAAEAVRQEAERLRPPPPF